MPQYKLYKLCIRLYIFIVAVQATVVEQPSEREPEIDDTNEIVLTVDNDMNVYQLTGNNVVVNS